MIARILALCGALLLASSGGSGALAQSQGGMNLQGPSTGGPRPLTPLDLNAAVNSALAAKADVANPTITGTISGAPSFSGTVPFGKSGGGEVQITDTGTQLAGTVLNVPTFQNMRSFQPDALTKTATIHTEGFARAGDGGGATYDWDSTNTCSVNGGNVVCVLPTGSTHTTTGRWRLRMTTGGVDVRANGAKCDGVTDDSTAINNLITNVSQFGGGDVVIPVSMAAAGVSGCVVSGANLALKSGVRLRGAFNPFSGPQGFNAYVNSAILLDPTKTITMAAGSTLSDLLIWRVGLAKAPTVVGDVFAALATWADGSVGVTVASSSIIERVRVVGFNTAFKQTGGGSNWLRDVQFDGINGFERAGANAVTNVDNMQANSWWASGFGGRSGVITATPSLGTAYTTGDTVQPSGGACTVRPSFTVTASGGVPSALAITNPGDCTTLPTGSAFTGGTGTGLTAAMVWRSGGYRPGIGVYDHEGIELLMTGGLFEQFATAIKVSNSSLNNFTNVMIEGAGNVNNQTVGFDAENCSENIITNSTITANWTNILANAKTDITAATCNVAGGNNNLVGLTKIIGGHVNGAQGVTNSSIVVGAAASVYASGLRISSGNLSSSSNVTVAANGNFTASGVIFTPISNHNPWITADATATVKLCGGTSDGSATLASIGYADTCRDITNNSFTTLSTSGTSALQGTTTIGTNATAATTVLNGPAASNRLLQWNTASVARWTMGTDNTAEGGLDAGSRLVLNGKHDAGTNWINPLTIDRKYGAIRLQTANPVTFAGSDPGTTLSTQGLRIDQYYTGTTTGQPLTFNQLWLRQDTVNDHSQGQVFLVQDEAACAGAGTCAPDATFTGSIAGSVLTISAVTTGAVLVGDFVTGSGVSPVHISSFGTGAGGTGTYNLDNSLSGTVGSEAMTTITPISTQGRNGVVSSINVQGPLDPNNTGTYDGERASVQVIGDGGGTATKGGTNAQAMNFIVNFSPGTTGWAAANAGQSNMYLPAGNNFTYRRQFFFNTTADNGTQAGQEDAFLNFEVSPLTGNQVGPYYGMQMQSLIVLGNGGPAIFPLDANNGELMSATPYLGALISPRPPMQAWRGFDIANVQFSDCVMCLPGARLMGDGALYSKRLSVDDATDGPVVDGTLSKASVSSIASGGTLFKVGEQYPSRLGGIIAVDTVSGGVVTAAHYIVPPYRAAGEVVQVAWSFVQNTSLSGQAVVSIRNNTPNIGIGDTVIAVGPASACNSAIPGATTVTSFSNGTGGLSPSITLSANLTANMTYGCQLSFRRTMLSSTDVIPVGSTGSFVVNLTWTAPTVLTFGGTAALVQIASPMAKKASTVALLPTCNSGAKYQELVVSDASGPTYGATVSGTGAVVTPVICDGTNWKAH